MCSIFNVPFFLLIIVYIDNFNPVYLLLPDLKIYSYTKWSVLYFIQYRQNFFYMQFVYQLRTNLHLLLGQTLVGLNCQINIHT